MNQSRNYLISFLVLNLTSGSVFASDEKSDFRSAKKDQDLIIAIVDTGIDLKNQSLRQFLWRNPGEGGLDERGRPKESNGIDDDDNGYVDDVYGWNFYDQNANLQDEIGHGTHVAGIISGQAGPSKKMSRPKVQFMILKYYAQKKKSRDTQLASNEALKYALKMGAKVINYSGGGLQADEQEKEIFLQFEKQSIWSIVAAGNESANLEDVNYYPAKYHLPHMLVVSSMDQWGLKSTFANYGKSIVDLFAVGENVMSFGLQQNLMMMSGTSQATAAATHSIAMLGQDIYRIKSKSELFKSPVMNLRISKQLQSFSRAGEYIDTELKQQVIASDKRIMTRP